MSKVYRLGIIGYGGMAGYHHERINERSDIDAVCMYDIKESACERGEKRGLKVHKSAEDLLNDNLDVVLIATPNEVHKSYAIAAMEKGINVICEKPVCMNSTELQEMIDCANRTGKLFTVHQNRRWDADFCLVKEIVKQDLIGDIFAIESRVQGANGIPGDWRAQKAHGGGMVLDWGVHLLDQILTLYPDKITQIYSKVQRITTQEVDDGFKAILTFETGMVVLVEVSTNTFINLPRWHVSGLYGTAIIEDWDNKGKIVRDKRKPTHDELKPIKAGAGLTKTMAPRGEETIEEIPLPTLPPDSDWKEYYNNIVDVLNGKTEQIVKHNQLMRSMKVMEAIFQSEAENKAIDVNL